MPTMPSTACPLTGPVSVTDGGGGGGLPGLCSQPLTGYGEPCTALPLVLTQGAWKEVDEEVGPSSDRTRPASRHAGVRGAEREAPGVVPRITGAIPPRWSVAGGVRAHRHCRPLPRSRIRCNRGTP